MRRKLFVLSTFALLAAATASPQDTSSNFSGRKDLRIALLQARDAVIEYANREGRASYEPDRIERKVLQLFDYLTFAGDNESVRYLREHLNKYYADKMKDPVPPPHDRETFSNLVKTIETEEDSSQHDMDLAAVSSREIECGFLDDAFLHAGLVRLSSYRFFPQGQIAVAAHENGNADLAQRALDAAIHSAVQEDSKGYPLYRPATSKLDQLAALFLEHDYQEGARKSLLQLQQLLPNSPQTTGYDWRGLAEKAIELGDFDRAAKALERVGPDQGHSDVEDAIKAAKARNLGPGQALKSVNTMVNPYSRSKSLCEIAERQSSSGDKRGAAATFQLALQTAEVIDEEKAFALNEIAWAQIHSGDRSGAEQTVTLALQENEEPQSGSSQEGAWASLADTLAYLGQFERARGIVMRISDAFTRGQGLGYIASRGTEAGRTQEMIEWASKLPDPEDRSETFLRLAETMIDQLKAGPKKQL